jgi:hypothetical protein
MAIMMTAWCGEQHGLLILTMFMVAVLVKPPSPLGIIAFEMAMTLLSS